MKHAIFFLLALSAIGCRSLMVRESFERPRVIQCSAGKAKVVNLLSVALAKRGYTITLASPENGILQAEIPSPVQRWSIVATDSSIEFSARYFFRGNTYLPPSEQEVGFYAIDYSVIGWIDPILTEAGNICGVPIPHPEDAKN